MERAPVSCHESLYNARLLKALKFGASKGVRRREQGGVSSCRASPPSGCLWPDSFSGNSRFFFSLVGLLLRESIENGLFFEPDIFCRMRSLASENQVPLRKDEPIVQCGP